MNLPLLLECYLWFQAYPHLCIGFVLYTLQNRSTHGYFTLRLNTAPWSLKNPPWKKLYALIIVVNGRRRPCTTRAFTFRLHMSIFSQRERESLSRSNHLHTIVTNHGNLCSGRYISGILGIYSLNGHVAWEGGSLKLQNSALLSIFKMWKIRNISFVGNLILSNSCEFYYDDVTVTSFIDIKYSDVADKSILQGTEFCYNYG